MPARTGRRPPAIPTAVEATPPIAGAIQRWARAAEDVGRKARVHDKLRDLGMEEAVARAYRAYEDAAKWEVHCWHELTTVVPLVGGTAHRLGDLTIAVSAASRSGKIHIAYRDGVEVRRSWV